jgi:hypothetical protein
MPLVLNAHTALVAIAVNRVQSGQPDQTRGRIYAGHLPLGPAALVWDVREVIQVLDHDSISDRTLILGGIDPLQRGGDLVVLEGLARGQPAELYRRKQPGMDVAGFKPQVSWARFLDADHVAVVRNDDLFVWNLVSAKLLYHVDKIAGRDAPPALSPGRHYLIVPHRLGATVIDVVEGKSLGFFQGENGMTPQVLMHPDGKRMILAAANHLEVFDLTAGRAPVNVVLAATRNAIPAGWYGENLLLSGNGDLIRADLGMVLWNYSLQDTAKWCAVPHGILAVAVDRSCQLRSLPVPHDFARRAELAVEQRRGELLSVRDGAEVELVVECPEEVESRELLAALTVSVKRAGWNVAPEADTTVAAVVSRGVTRQLAYRNSRVPARGGQIESVSITPFTSGLEIRQGEQVLWKRESVGRLPPVVVVQDGETMQEALQRLERPDAAFYSRLQLPTHVPLPAIIDGLGRSTLEGASWKDVPVNVRPSH